MEERGRAREQASWWGLLSGMVLGCLSAAMLVSVIFGAKSAVGAAVGWAGGGVVVVGCGWFVLVRGRGWWTGFDYLKALIGAAVSTLGVFGWLSAW